MEQRNGGQRSVETVRLDDGREARAKTLNCFRCDACCRSGDTITLFPDKGDDPGRYQTVRGPDGEHVLAKKKNGRCVYLLPNKRGCKLHGKKPKPWQCRNYDCRRLLAYTQEEVNERMTPAFRKTLEAALRHLPNRRLVDVRTDPDQGR